MATNKLDDRTFDEMLGRALKKHSEAVPAGFTTRMLRQIEQAEERRVLARVVLKERLALAACIAFAGSVVIAAVAFPGFLSGVFAAVGTAMAGQGDSLLARVPKIAEGFQSQWRLYAVLAGVFVFVVYGIVDLFFDERLRLA
jgi:hypothetical protein